jgi:hypothetical protein
MSKTQFAQKEWDDFGISDLRYGDFIKSGDAYFTPCMEACVDLEDLNRSDPFVSLLLYGGFLYLNEMYDVVAVNAFFCDEVDESRKDVKSVIHLGSPTSLDTDCMTRLKELDRFQPVTVQWLVDLGYSDFAWICPSEVLGDLVFPVDGGFAYRNKDKPEENCFVPVVAPETGVKENETVKEKEPQHLRFVRSGLISDYNPR